MALNEACQLWLEQEIEDGLKKGEKPYSLGQRIANEVLRLFEVRMKPKTIAKRADRLLHSTNVENKSQPIEIKEHFRPSIIENRSPQGGGFRENAGRPKNIEIEHPDKPLPTGEYMRCIVGSINSIVDCTIEPHEIAEILFYRSRDRIHVFKLAYEIMGRINKSLLGVENENASFK